MTAKSIETLIDQAKARFGGRAVIEDRDQIAPWLDDWRGRYHGQARAILSPSSTAEAAELVRMAAQAHVALVPQGGNTSMVGGATPPADGSALILSSRRMNRLRAISAADNLAIAEAGMILADLHDSAAAVGRRFPLTLGARGSCTVGGLVATNAGGTQVLRFGTMRALVAGIEAVLPDGSVHDGLTPLKKDNRGYNIDQLLVGSEGTLAFITAAALRLVPAVEARAVAWAGLADPGRALELLYMTESSNARVEGFELIAGNLLELVVRHVPGTRQPLAGKHRWHVLLEATTSDRDDRPEEALEDLLARAHSSGLVEDATISASETQAEAMWRIRDSVSEAIRAEGPSTAHDISVPIAGMPDFIAHSSLMVERAFPACSATAFGHLGDGNLHYHVRAPAGAGAEWLGEYGDPVTRLVHDLVTAAGGSISAEHGIGQMKRDELARLASPAHLMALRSIKSAIDPAGLMNPGKLVP